eukprot:TRINITY_DN20957_c0_g1_i2.p1 TRINITY_DN20957_c0_g1~~TRINITY_DN20957_c0_g1_i2.p1  ORF type:complete len:1048 (+),score=191.76 TRINITY_DN20957_c0_g1_i2:99-3242(+)
MIKSALSLCLSLSLSYEHTRILNFDYQMAVFNATCFHLNTYSAVSPATHQSKQSNFPPTFKIRASTSGNVGSEEKTIPDKVKTQQTVPPTVFGNAQNPILIREKNEQIDYCVSLLQNRIPDKPGIPDTKQIHAQIIKSGIFYSDGFSFLKNKLVILYVKNSGSVDYARQLFDEIPERTVPAYATLIGSYARLLQWDDVLSVFGLMVRDGVEPDKFLVPTILKACGALQALSVGTMVHAFVMRKMLELDVFVGNSLIDMYAKCGRLRSSRQVFDLMVERDVVSWTVLLTACADAGLLDEAVDIFESMQLNGVKPDLISWNALISCFAQNGDIDVALQLLEKMQEKGTKPEVISWNGIISGCVQNEYFEDAFDMFCRMRLSENPNAVTVVTVLSACSGLHALNLGKEMHSYVMKHEHKSNVFVGGALIDMYSKCGRIDYAERVFAQIRRKNTALCNNMIGAYVSEGKMEDVLELLHLMRVEGLKPDIITYNTMLAGYAKMGQKDKAFDLFSEMGQVGLKPNIVSLNVLISGFQQQGLSREALNLFRTMQSPSEIVLKYSNVNTDSPAKLLDKRIHPNAITITSALSACSDLNLMYQGKEVHAYILRNCFEGNVVVSSALVDMYSKCQDMESAVKVFHRISDKNTISWNILMAGHNHNREPEVALRLFPKMLEDGFIPSSITLIILVSACSNIAALRLGRQLHGYIEKCESDESTVTVASVLIDMYAKCGGILEAALVFNSTTQKDVVLWNAMISGYSMHGMAKDAIRLFKQLEASGVKPDHITFIAVLSACSHEGLVEEGWKYFNLMESVYGITPTLEHYTCMVGIMGGAGLLDEALNFMRRMPCQPDACMWATLLRACRVHSNSEIGEKAAKALFELEPNNASNYIALSNIYGMNGLWDAAVDVRIAMRARGLNTVLPCSWIEVGNMIHAFKAGESPHPESERIFETWDRLAQEMENAGYFPHEITFHDGEEVDPFSCFHTEKLALCYGIISSHSHSPIRISKNIRMCIDCHTSTKLISKIDRREIFIKDGCFYHHFKDGMCSCRDNW